MSKFTFDDLAHVAAQRAELKALRGKISPVDYARLMHDCDVAQAERLTVEAANNPTVREMEARVARSTLTVVPGGK